MNIVEELSPRNPLDVRLLAANRFLLEQIREDYRLVSGRNPLLDQVRIRDGITDTTS